MNLKKLLLPPEKNVGVWHASSLIVNRAVVVNPTHSCEILPEINKYS